MKPIIKGCLSVLLLLIVAGSSVGDDRDVDGDGYVKVLLPIAFSINQELPGAHGSVWRTEIWVHNGTAYGIDLQPHLCDVPVVPCVPEFSPGSFGPMTSVTSNHNHGGALLYIPLPPEEHDLDPVPDPDEIHLSARLLELSRRAQPTGVELPVVRELDFLTREAVLLAVPVGEGIRSALRVYDPTLIRGSAVGIELLDPNGNLIAGTTLHPGNDPVVPEQKQAAFYFLPGYDAIHNLTDVFPELRQFDHFHVRLTPLTPDWEYWGFVSVTDDETQHVLLITPQ
jgi:hypothetical protein